MKHILIMSMLTLWMISCLPTGDREPLPILGERDVINGDTIYPTIPDFAFINQDSQIVTNSTFANKAYVVDFFFISCPTICPRVTKQMLRLYERYEKEDRLLLLAHSIDTKRDTVGRLRDYARNLGVRAAKWHFVTGNKEEIYSIADKYFTPTPREDPTAPGGFDHSGMLILVDKNRHVRAFCDGTDPESVDQFMKDIDRLLRQEYAPIQK